jgi:hypothetical protein
MAKIFIDNQQYTVHDGQNLLQASLSLKLDLPYFAGTRQWAQWVRVDNVP